MYVDVLWELLVEVEREVTMKYRTSGPSDEPSAFIKAGYNTSSQNLMTSLDDRERLRMLLTQHDEDTTTT